MPTGLLTSLGFSVSRRKRLGDRQLAAAFVPDLIGIERKNRAFKEGASMLGPSKGFASGKNHAALNWGAGALWQPFEIQDVDN
jgi:hypothetical protein